MNWKLVKVIHNHRFHHFVLFSVGILVCAQVLLYHLHKVCPKYKMLFKEELVFLLLQTSVSTPLTEWK